ncbi:MAG: hypothetical protein CL944_01405 [Candidatus Diapherotrites archaeon]|uniref:Uncharacterized protein n=1 Tax=Candidatus Iainarchaeum sp. TaxID=3101447 RepID=A0A2D6LPL7_9ARCH|nr:hypothetical protein [Candidatus Diapherotrites archaeon]|tara:strand:+ start:5685 stop:6032 length:348 start_codon:yes stop_codon:yes gene_type:complete
MDKVHFTRAPKAKELEQVLKNGNTIYLTKSAKQRLSDKAKKKIKDSGAELVIESARGRPIELNLQTISEIVELHKDHRTFREIEKITGISKSTAHYLIKYAERNKIKKGKKVVYL